LGLATKQREAGLNQKRKRRGEGGREGGREGERTYHLSELVFIDGGGAEAGPLGHDLVQDLEHLVVGVAYDGWALWEGREGGREEGGRRGE